MTKNRKIKLLVKDNKRLTEENQRMHELSNESLSQKMLTEMERYTDVIEKLYGQYRELDRLKMKGIKNRWPYRIMQFKCACRHIGMLRYMREVNKGVKN